MMSRTLLFACLLWTAYVAFAAAADAPAAKPDLQMNGIRFSDYADSLDTWKLVTVHYRTDTGELRFAYANSKAYATLMAGSIDYPDGAAFAKISVISGDDPAFIDSKIPIGALRDQFMVRDKVRYAATGGWGFALFNERQLQAYADAKQSVTAPGHLASPEPESTDVCFACHQVVKDRGYVFSFPAHLKPGVPAILRGSTPVMSFTDYRIGKLPENLRRLLPQGTMTVRFLVTPSQQPEHLIFIGEFRPMLIHEAAQTELPALFFSDSSGAYIAVIPLKQDHLPNGLTCPSGQKAYETFGSESFTNIGKDFCD
jgi:Cytochrome P460